MGLDLRLEYTISCVLIIIFLPVYWVCVGGGGVSFCCKNNSNSSQDSRNGLGHRDRQHLPSLAPCRGQGESTDFGSHPGSTGDSLLDIGQASEDPCSSVSSSLNF